MIVGIDASNIRGGGGLTHLREVLCAGQPPEFGIDRVIVWGGGNTIRHLPGKPWLNLVHHPMLDRRLLSRFYWQQVKLTQVMAESCDLLFVPGGTYLGTFEPFVTMSRNLLPFDLEERRRYGLSRTRLRLAILETVQRLTFRQADGLIFLTETAQRIVRREMGTLPRSTAVIAHGVSSKFRCPPRSQVPISEYSSDSPFRWLYVSKVNPYKHQWQVVKAVATLRQEGIPVALDLVGPVQHSPAMDRLRETIKIVDPGETFVHYHGSVPYSRLAEYYCHTDAFVFASSCETFGQILLESMASGLPIACSRRSAMPEVLGNAGIYFDPEDPEDIAKALLCLTVNRDLRKCCAWAAYERALDYSWERCARETFNFIAKVYEAVNA